ncbi:MAG TPA: hypothetical protein VFX21_04350, partial [Acidimicrobiia bacterium]|nr:hypothetical protein [Acidimicrobiia bacterium]
MPTINVAPGRVYWRHDAEDDGSGAPVWHRGTRWPDGRVELPSPRARGTIVVYHSPDEHDAFRRTVLHGPPSNSIIHFQGRIRARRQWVTVEDDRARDEQREQRRGDEPGAWRTFAEAFDEMGERARQATRETARLTQQRIRDHQDDALRYGSSTRRYTYEDDVARLTLPEFTGDAVLRFYPQDEPTQWYTTDVAGNLIPIPEPPEEDEMPRGDQLSFFTDPRYPPTFATIEVSQIELTREAPNPPFVENVQRLGIV